MTYFVTAGSELERQYEHTIRKTVEGVLQAAQHPRTAVSITLQVVSDDGALLACALNAACAALVDAAVPMTSIFGVHLNSTLCQKHMCMTLLMWGVSCGVQLHPHCG